MRRNSISLTDLRQLSVDDIDVAEENVRKTQTEKGTQLLQNSIKKFGLIQPVVVIPNGDRFNLIVGQRRFLAFKELKKKTIPALVVNQLTKRNRMIVSFGENILRKALPYADTIELCNTLFKEYRGEKSERIKKIADDLGISSATVSNYLAAQLVPTKVRDLVDKGKLSRELAYRITAAHFPNIEKITAIVNHVTKLTREEKQRAAEYGSKHPSAGVDSILDYAKNPPPMVELTIHIDRDLDKRLSELSKRNNTDVADILRLAIDRYLEEEE